MTAGAVIYEVRLRVGDEIVEPFDAWLADHVDDMLRFDGFEAAETIKGESPEPGSALRIVRYRIASRAQLQNYLDEHAARMRAEGLARFGERFSATRETYPAAADTAYATEHHCRNCEAPLRGQYCAECGQRDKHRIISLWSLLRDVIGDLFEIDSRVWRTILPLLGRPGHLTREYLRGRQVRYTPPFRLYLVTSLLFFLIAFFGAENSAFTINGDDEAVAEIRRGIDSSLEEVAAEVSREIEAARHAAGKGPKLPSITDTAPGISAADVSVADTPAANTVTRGEATGGTDDAREADAAGSGSDDKCADISLGEGQWQDALAERAKAVCRKLTAEGGAKRFVAGLIDNLPGMMFVFLPLIALVMKLLYPLARRFYVEHLLFAVHFHSFFFLALTISVLVSRLPAAIPGQGVVSGLLTAALVFYTPIYLFMAMRRVYGQHFFVTTIKFAALMSAYFVSLMSMFVVVVLFTALNL